MVCLKTATIVLLALAGIGQAVFLAAVAALHSACNDDGAPSFAL